MRQKLGHGATGSRSLLPGYSSVHVEHMLYSLKSTTVVNRSTVPIMLPSNSVRREMHFDLGLNSWLCYLLTYELGQVG